MSRSATDETRGRSLRAGGIGLVIGLVLGVGGTLALYDRPSDTPYVADQASPAGDVAIDDGTASTTDDDTTTDAAAAHPDACTLLTHDEAERLAATPLAEGVGTGNPTPTYCQFAGPTDGPIAQVDVFVGDGAKKQLDTDRDVLHHEFADVPGVGDEAYEEDFFVFVRVGETWASVHLVRMDSPDVYREALRTAAGLVAERLAP